MKPVDHHALGHIIPLVTYVRSLRDRARDADWTGDTDTARRLDREVDDAVKAGQDPVPMF